MASPADAAGEIARSRLLRELRERLEAAHELAATVQARLVTGEVLEIESATARLETLAQELKLLAEEYDRLPPAPEQPGERVAREQAALENTAARIARSSAITGGLLERMVTISRSLLGLIGAAKDGVYQPTGRAPEPPLRGLRLKEWG